MNEQLHIDANARADEVARYLAVVDAFREANSEPTWRPEPVPTVTRLEAPVPAVAARVAH
jgi:hypothetical protein